MEGVTLVGRLEDAAGGQFILFELALFFIT